MANIRVDALTEVTTIADDDVVMVDGEQGVRATTWGTLKNLIKQQCGINELNTKIEKEYQAILHITDLTGNGNIPNFRNYKEFVIIVNAAGFTTSHYIPKSVLQTGMVFSSSYYYSATSFAMATIGLNTDGGYTIGQGVVQNSQGSSIIIWAR